MADPIISVVVRRIATLMEEEIRSEVKLVRGVKKGIQSLSDELKMVRNVLDDAEKKGYSDKSIKDWLTRLENTSYEMDDVLDEWNYSILKFKIEQHSNNKVRFCIPSSCLCFKKVASCREIALKIEEVKSRLDLILAEKDRFGFEIKSQPNEPCHESWRVQTTSLVDLEEVCGREFESENLVRKLIVGGMGESLGVRVLSIVGVGGLGKTTLAKLAYNDSRVLNCFELRIWVCVSDPFDVFGIANGIIERAGGSKRDTNQLDMLLDHLRESISGKKFLLVLDDVWSHNNAKWEPLKNSLKYGGAGSKILVTTRDENVAIVMGTFKNEIHYLRHLSHEHCWLLLGRIALSRKNMEECEKFQNIGKEITIRCKGLPLAAKTLGSLLRFKKTLEEWESVLNSEIWELEEVEVNLFPHLLLSYNELSPTLKRCFSYCAVFPKDFQINVEKLVTEWKVLGYLGHNGDWKLRGREYFDKLAARSFFLDFRRGSDSNDPDQEIRSFKMHDIVHDFAQFLRKDVRSGKKKTTCKDCNPLLVSQVEKYGSLYYYDKELPDLHLCDRLISVRLLSLRHCGLCYIPYEIEKLIHLRWLDLGHNKIFDHTATCKLYNLQFLWLDRCHLKHISSDIGNLIHLIHLDLSWNVRVKELPESLCNLHELESLDVRGCSSLSRLPQGIEKLIKLKHLYNSLTYRLEQYPQGLAQLTSLVTLTQFPRRDGSKLGWLKNLNRLSGSLNLMVEISGGSDDLAVEDAREAELGKKKHIQKLVIDFGGFHYNRQTRMCREEVKELVWNDVLDALQPHRNLQDLHIEAYKGSRLPGWIASPFNQLRSIKLEGFAFCSLLPPFGKLPLLETLWIESSSELKFVGREFLGITTTSSSSSSMPPLGTIIGFPKLKKLKFWSCANWKEWEDITAEEEDSVAVSIMPCLTELQIWDCNGLTELPQRLLRKVSSSLKVFNIDGSTQLKH